MLQELSCCCSAPPALFWERPHLLLIQVRQTCIDRNECILVACDVSIIWPFAHMRIAFGLRLTLLVDDVERVRKRFLISFRSVRSWLWSELMLKWATQEICGMCPQWPWDSRGPLGSSLDSIRGSQGKPTPRYKGVRLRADALAASALQEGAGEAKQQRQFSLQYDRPTMQTHSTSAW